MRVVECWEFMDVILYMDVIFSIDYKIEDIDYKNRGHCKVDYLHLELPLSLFCYFSLILLLSNIWKIITNNVIIRPLLPMPQIAKYA